MKKLIPFLFLSFILILVFYQTEYKTFQLPISKNISRKKIPSPKPTPVPEKENAVKLELQKHQAFKKGPHLKQAPAAWKKRLRKELLRFQTPETSVSIRENEGVYYFNGNKNRPVKSLTITYREKGRFLSSYKALVNHKNSRILSVYDRVKHEDTRVRHPRLKYTGIIKNPKDIKLPRERKKAAKR